MADEAEVPSYAEHNSMLVAADSANLAAGSQRSFVQNAGDFLTTSLYSGFASIYNTGANWVNASQIDVLKNLEENDAHAAEFYKENRNAADITGFLAGSFVPGGIAIKGMQLAKLGVFGSTFGRAVGFASSKQTMALNAALEELAAPGGTVFNQITRNKLAATAWATADQTINVAAMQTAVSLTMKQSPMLEHDDWVDVGKNIVFSSMAFGAVGGLVEHLVMGSVMKSAMQAISQSQRNYDLLTLVQGNLPGGDKAYQLARSILELPEKGLDIPFSYTLKGEKVIRTLPTTELLEKTAKSTADAGWLKFAEGINDLSGGDAVIGNRFAKFMQDTIISGKAAGKSKDDILEDISDRLFSVARVTRVSEDSAQNLDDVFYLAKTFPKEKIPQVKSVDDLLAVVASRAPTALEDGTPNLVSKFPYKIVGDTSQMQIGRVTLDVGGESVASTLPHFGTLDDAWKAGVDAVVLDNGTLRINPKSANFTQFTKGDPILRNRQFLNFQTGAQGSTVFPTIADIATPAEKLAVKYLNGKPVVVAGSRAFAQTEMNPWKLTDMDSLKASARYVWANSQNLEAVPARISETDIPLLERIYQDGAKKWKGVELLDEDGGIKTVEQITDFGKWLKNQKLQILQKHLAETPKGEDLSLMGVKLNADPRWIQQAIENGFQDSAQLDKGFSLALDASLQPANAEVVWDFGQSIELSKKLLQAQGIPQKGLLPKATYMVQQLPAGANNVIYGNITHAYNVKVATDQLKSAFAAVMGEDAAKFLELDANVATKMADQAGSGPSLLKFSNADYNDPLRLWSQHTGALVNRIGKDRANAALTEFQDMFIALSQPENKAAAAELGTLTTALRRSADDFGFDATNPKLLINKDARTTTKGGGWTLDAEKAKALEAEGRIAKYTIENDLAAQIAGKFVAHNESIIGQQKVLTAARGYLLDRDPWVMRPPSIDTGRYPFYAFVRMKAERLNGDSQVSMITARTADELRARAAKVPDEYQVIFKDDSVSYHKAIGDYDYQLTLKDVRIDSTLQRKGVLGDFFPETAAPNVLDDYVNAIQKKELGLLRWSVETRYAQTFAELRSLGAQFEKVATSKTGDIFQKFRSQATDPFNEYIKTALDISKRSEYTLLHEANEFTEALGKSAYRIFETNKEKALQKLIPWEEANDLSRKYGLQGPYVDEAAYYLANKPETRNIAREFVSKANMFMVNLNLRLDFAQSLINVISTPVLASSEFGDLKKAAVGIATTKLPGTDVEIPSLIKAAGTAISNFWGPEKAALIERYRSINAIKDTLSIYHDMIDAFSYKPFAKVGEISAAANRGIELGSKITGNNWAEQFTRFVSADVARQITEPLVVKGAMSLAEQDAYIGVYVNRVQGNYIASQRPILFQGVLGSAVSLFQTYQFNLLQQLFRHVGERDTKAALVMMGMQGSLYGLNGIPFFEAVNTHLIGNSTLNPEHRDIASTAATVSKAVTDSRDMGNWLMYGTASAFPLFSSKSPALYTRGDINPRHISIIPISPLDVPAVDGSIRFIKNLLDMGEKMAVGLKMSNPNMIKTAFLEGLEHNNINRPLAGIAQVFQGYDTTSKASLISASNDFFSISTLARVGGAKPMDESLALNSLFRLKSYEAADTARINDLGEAVKTRLRKNQVPSQAELEDFQLQYAKAGGRIENYFKAVQTWSKDANSSTVNAMLDQHKTSYSKRLSEIMGATRLPDFRSQPPAAPIVSAAAAGTPSGTPDMQPSLAAGGLPVEVQ